MSKITYVKGSIVDAFHRGENIAHCVSCNFEMGIGVAKALVDAEPYIKVNLKNTYSGIKFKPFCATWHSTRWEKHVYNLVTKDRYFQKPTVDTLRLSIMSMRSELERRYGLDVSINVSMPAIASGADKIPWGITEKLLKDLLPDSFNITVYKLNDNPRKGRVRYE